MGLVVAFSVRGIADGADLPLTKRSGDLQTKSVGEPFEITFDVGIRSNTTKIYNNANPKRLVNESGKNTADGTGIIDAQGYSVYYATNGTAYRTLQNQPSGTFYRREVGTRPILLSIQRTPIIIG